MLARSPMPRRGRVSPPMARTMADKKNGRQPGRTGGEQGEYEMREGFHSCVMPLILDFWPICGPTGILVQERVTRPKIRVSNAALRV